MNKKLLAVFIYLSCLVGMSQTTINGTIFNEYLEPFPGAVINSPSGTVTSNFDGEFTLMVKKFPITIKISSVGYSTEELEIATADAGQNLNIILKETLILNQLVMSASRTPERVMESPVTIERIGENEIKNTASVNFYEGLGNLKGIDVLGNSYSTKIVASNRGFASALNNRFVQLIDGAESSIPVFEYSYGNVFGLNELDVKNVEILPGAASALYGANAFNGILLMTSKNPFDDQGISTYFKTGITTQEDRSNAAFYDVGIRMAHAFSDKIALKANLVYNTAEDWHAIDTRNSSGQGGVIIAGQSHADDKGYDGVNVYGDEVSFNLRDLVRSAEISSGGAIPSGTYLTVEDTNISRVGYQEKDIHDFNAKYMTFDSALHYRPWGEKSTEVIISSKLHLTDNVLHASNRYSQKDAFMEQYKVELKGENYFLRGYYTESDAAKTTDSRLSGISVANDWRDHRTYFGLYTATYLGNLFGGQTDEAAHAIARQAAESGRFEPGTSEYNSSLAKAKNTTISNGGALLIDNSAFYHVDANYNLAEKIDFADIQLGGSFRSFALDSQGQVYTDDDGIIRLRQYGLYTQIQKKINDERLKLTGTIRYDKAKNFDGNFSPRATISYAAGNTRDHNFRLAYQTAFRNPTTQDQYLGLQLGNRVFLGSVEENLTREITTLNYSSDASQSVTLTGEDAVNNSYTLSSVEEYQNEVRYGRELNIGVLEKAEISTLKPETVQSFELGYRGAVKLAENLFEFDIVGYYNFHKDFITTKQVITPFYGNVGTPEAAVAIGRQDFLRYVVRTNTDAKIDAYGFATGFATKIFGGFDFRLNYAYSDFSVNSEDIDFKPSFNTPKHKVKAQFGHDRLFKNIGFAVNTRWQDEFLYQSRFIDALVDDRFVVDAQINFTIPKWKSFVKIGGSNLTNKDYTSVPGSGTIGSQYYISWTINN